MCKYGIMWKNKGIIGQQYGFLILLMKQADFVARISEQTLFQRRLRCVLGAQPNANL